MQIAIIFIFGLCVGSFLNCVIYRLGKSESFLKGRPRRIRLLADLRGRSYCPHCKHKLGVLDLIPVFSFVFLGGKCRYCRRKISWQYPIVELVTGILFVLVFLALGFRFWVLGFGILTPNTQNLTPFYFLLRDWLFIAVLIVVFVYDLKHYIIPDKIVLPAAGLALVVNLLLGYPILKLVLSAVIISGFFLLQYLVSKGKWIGFGDIKFGLLIGFLLSWPYVIVALFLAYIIGAVVGIILIILKKKSMKSEVPFGPFLALATVVVLLYGESIFDWYFSILRC